MLLVPKTARRQKHFHFSHSPEKQFLTTAVARWLLAVSRKNVFSNQKRALRQWGCRRSSSSWRVSRSEHCHESLYLLGRPLPGLRSSCHQHSSLPSHLLYCKRRRRRKIALWSSPQGERPIHSHAALILLTAFVPMTMTTLESFPSGSGWNEAAAVQSSRRRWGWSRE